MAHVGALIELQKHIPFKAVKEWMGVSAGSLVAMCLCIGFTLDELLDFSVHFDFTHIKDVDSVPGWVLHFGMDTGERLHKLIEACLHVKNLPSDFSFQACRERFGLSLRIVATDLNHATPAIFSPTDTPDYCIAHAVRASMTVPYYFQPFICPLSGHYLVDGSVISNYPLFVLPTEEHGRTLSILIRTSVEKKEDLTGSRFDELLSRPLNVTLVEKARVEARFYDARCIQILLGDLNILEFSFEEDAKMQIVNKGKEAVAMYYREGGRLGRRKSCTF